jgi:hypothetical protein
MIETPMIDRELLNLPCSPTRVRRRPGLDRRVHAHPIIALCPTMQHRQRDAAALA